MLYSNDNNDDNDNNYTCDIDMEICYSCRLLGRPRIPIQGH